MPMAQWPSVAPARPEEQVSALAAPAVAHDEERVAEEAEGELAAAAPVQPRGRQAPALPGVEYPPHVVERHQLELEDARRPQHGVPGLDSAQELAASREARVVEAAERAVPAHRGRSEEHTSELQSQSNLVCRLLLEKKKKNTIATDDDEST